MGPGIGAPHDVWMGGDQALIVGGAEDTLTGQPPLVGAYSKGGLSHPGPLYTYLVAGSYAACGRSLTCTTWLLNLVQSSTLLWVGLVAGRVAGGWLPGAAVPLLIAFTFPFILYNRLVWNLSIVSALLALAILLASSQPRARWSVVVQAAVASALAQAHMAFAGVAAALFACSLASAWLNERRRLAWILTVTSCALAVVCWLPPLIEAWRHDGGNLFRLWELAGTAKRQPWREVWNALAIVWTEGMPPALPSLTIVLGAAVVAIGARATAGPAMSKDQWYVIGVVGVTAIAMVVSIRRVPGEIETYYLRPLVVVFALVCSLAAGLGVTALRGRYRTTGELVLVAVIIASIGGPLRAERDRFSNAAWNGFRLDHLQATADYLSTSCCRAGPASDRERGEGPCQVGVELNPPDLKGAAASLQLLLALQEVSLTPPGGRCSLRVMVDAKDTGTTPSFRAGRYTAVKLAAQ